MSATRCHICGKKLRNRVVGARRGQLAYAEHCVDGISVRSHIACAEIEEREQPLTCREVTASDIGYRADE